jgi:hypothetical protein
MRTKQMSCLCHAAEEGKKKIEIYVINKIIKEVNGIKYLGIIFDSKITFREHINYIEEKCTKLFFSLSRSAKIKRGFE